MSWINWLFPWLYNPKPIEYCVHDIVNSQIFSPGSIDLEDFLIVEPHVEQLYYRLSLLDYPVFNKKYINPAYNNQYYHVHKLHPYVVNNIEVDFVVDNPGYYAGPTNRKYSIYLDGKLVFRISKTSREVLSHYQANDHYEPPYRIETDNYFSLEEIHKIYPVIDQYLQNNKNTIEQARQQLRNQFDESMQKMQIQADKIKAIEQSKKSNLLNKLLDGLNG